MASSFLLQAVNSATKEVLHNAAINNMRFVLYICIIYRVTCVDDRFGVNHTRIREFRADACVDIGFTVDAKSWLHPEV
jgi:hypothetical protein